MGGVLWLQVIDLERSQIRRDSVLIEVGLDPGNAAIVVLLEPGLHVSLLPDPSVSSGEDVFELWHRRVLELLGNLVGHDEIPEGSWPDFGSVVDGSAKAC